MSTDLVDVVDSLKRAVAPPDSFETLFPDVTEDGLVGQLLDALGDAQLDGFFPGFTSTDDGVVTEDLSRGERALLVLYAASTLLANEIRNRKSHVKYKAGSVEFEQDQGVGVLTRLLDQAQERKRNLIDRADTGGAGAAFIMADAYLTRSAGASSLDFDPTAYLSD